jgi:hypothetical protein
VCSHRRLPGALDLGSKTKSRYDCSVRREAAAIFTARDEPRLSTAASAASARSGNAAKDNKAFLVGNGAYRSDHRSGGRHLQQPQQGVKGQLRRQL